MVISPYSTSTGKMYAKSIEEVLFAIRQNEMSSSESVTFAFKDEYVREDIYLPEGVLLVTSSADNVSPFGHPIVAGVVEKGEAKFQHSNRQGDDAKVYIDGRGFTTITRERVLKLSNRDEFEMAMIRAGLTSYVARNDSIDLLSLGNYPLQIWIRWLTDIISRRTGLAPNYQRNVSVIVGVYYFSLFANINDASYSQLPEKEKIKIARAIQTVTSIPSEITFDLLDRLPIMRDLEDLAAALVEHSGAISLSSIGAGTLRAMVGGSWIGNNSREIACIALEHAPTYFAMLFRALRSKTHSKTLLGTAAIMGNKHRDGDQWMKGLLSLPGVVPKSYS